jgi:hypothetical protein
MTPVTKRALKIGFGIAFLIVGLFTTIGGVALISLVGADGRFEMPETRAHTRGHALVFDAIYVRGNLPTSGSLSATLGLEVRPYDGDGEIFVGVGPSDRVRRYLAEVAYDRVVSIDWPGGAGTEPVGGTGEPAGPPGERTWWEASDEGEVASVDWTVQGGDWSVVIMNADGSADVDVAGTVEVELPVLGPISVGLLIAGVVILAIGVLLTVSGAKTPKTGPSLAGAPPPQSAEPPRRPDA